MIQMKLKRSIYQLLETRSIPSKNSNTCSYLGLVVYKSIDLELVAEFDLYALDAQVAKR